MDGGVERLLKDRARGARAGKKPISAEVRLAIVKRTGPGEARARDALEGHVAEEIGVGHTTVQRVWKEHGLKPHLTRPFKLSNDPEIAEKVVDIVGLYLNPPDKAVVLCVDEKSQIQALESHATGPADEEGPCSDDDARLQAQWHDDIVRGTRCEDRQGHRRVSAAPPRQGVHPFPEEDRPGRSQAPRRACDLRQLQDPQDPGGAGWLAKHPRFKLHFTPTSSSWINLVERLFTEITRQQIRRGVFKSVAELEAAIETWLTERNAKPKPFKWTAKANIILEKNARARRALEEDLAAGTK